MKAKPNYELTFVSCTSTQPAQWCHIYSTLYARRGACEDDRAENAYVFPSIVIQIILISVQTASAWTRQTFPYMLKRLQRQQ